MDCIIHPKVKGAGYLHTHKTVFLMHSVLTASPESAPNGVLSAEMWMRVHEDIGKASNRKNKKLADKESSRWLRAIIAVTAK